MKKILFTLVVFLMTFTVSLAASNPKEKITETYENGSVKQKVFVYEAYYKFVSYFMDGTIEEIGYYDSNGEKNGNWVRYNEKGVVIAEASYKNGYKHGEWKIYNNEGQLTMYILYKNGVRKSACSWNYEKGLVVKN